MADQSSSIVSKTPFINSISKMKLNNIMKQLKTKLQWLLCCQWEMGTDAAFTSSQVPSYVFVNHLQYDVRLSDLE